MTAPAAASVERARGAAVRSSSALDASASTRVATTPSVERRRRERGERRAPGAAGAGVETHRVGGLRPARAKSPPPPQIRRRSQKSDEPGVGFSMSDDGWPRSRGTRAEGDRGPRTLTASEAAALIGVSVATIRGWADQGRLPSHRTVGNHRRFELDELRAWLADRGRGAPRGRPPARAAPGDPAVPAARARAQQPHRGDRGAGAGRLRPRRPDPAHRPERAVDAPPHDPLPAHPRERPRLRAAGRAGRARRAGRAAGRPAGPGRAPGSCSTTPGSRWPW